LGDLATVLRCWFVGVYAFGLTFMGIRARAAAGELRRAERALGDRRRLLPGLLIPVNWLLPPVFLITGFGALHRDWPVVRGIGMALSLYAIGLLATVPRFLGRQLVPKAVVFSDHQLVTDGPFRWIRHPTYSAVLALWLGAALATLDAILLVLFLFPLVGLSAQARAEEELLRDKFGDAYEAYARRTGRFVPRPGRGAAGGAGEETR